MDRVQMLGRTKNTAIYEVFNHEDKDLIELKTKYRNLFEDAWETYSNADWTGARIIFGEYQKLVPDDQLPKVFLDRINILEMNEPKNWEGIYLQDSK